MLGRVSISEWCSRKQGTLDWKGPGSGEWAKAADKKLQLIHPKYSQRWKNSRRLFGISLGPGARQGRVSGFGVVGSWPCDRFSVRPLRAPSHPPHPPRSQSSRVAWPVTDWILGWISACSSCCRRWPIGGCVSRCGLKMARHNFVPSLSHLQSSNLTSKSSVFDFPAHVQPFGSERKRALNVLEAQATAVPFPREAPEGQCPASRSGSCPGCAVLRSQRRL